MDANCWEIKRCGLQPGGSKCDEKGVCPAASDDSFNNLNNGKNGGRICWAVSGTLCDGEIQGTYAQKRVKCLVCDVFKKVKKEQGIVGFTLVKPESAKKKALSRY